MPNRGNSDQGRTPTEFAAAFLKGLPSDFAATFTARQLWTIYQAYGPWSGKERRRGWHGRFPTPWGRCAVSVRLERRGEHREQHNAEVKWRGIAVGAVASAAVLVVAYTLLY